MTVYLDPMDAFPHELDLVSPELVLVDPELARAARALLVSPPVHARSRPFSSAPAGSSAFGAWAPAERVHPVREQYSRRLLVGVATATMLALLLFDVRVEVGERPAAADSSASAVGTSSRATGPSSPPVSTPRVTTPPSARPSTKKPFRATDRRFAWAPIPGASGYHVEFFRSSSRVFAKQTTGPYLTVPGQWTINGSRRSLRPGTYRWYVWPIVAGKRQSQAVVQATVSISAS